MELRSLPVLPGSAFLPGAHHPHCPRHQHHLLWFGTRPLCLGCTCMAAGFFVGACTTCAVLPTEIAFLPWIMLHVALVVPTVAQPWLQWKPYKITARFMLGLASATWLLGSLVPKGTGLPLLAETGASIALFLVLAKLMLRIRERATPSPCTHCPLGAYPTCSWNLPRLLASADDADLKAALSSVARG